MAEKALPCPTLVRLLLEYDPEDGSLKWRARRSWQFRDGKQMTAEALCRRWNLRFAGRLAFTTYSCGGHHGSLLYRNVRAHRLIWAIYYGKWPDNEIDHINGNPRDNRIVNLRDVTHAQNAWNIGSHIGSSSKYAGVSRRGNRWRARVLSIDGREIHLGTYDTEQEAALVRDREIAKIKGVFPRLNFKGVA